MDSLGVDIELNRQDGCPVISFVGWSGSGKTTFLEQVVTTLSQQGVAVGIIKHHGHDSESLDVKGKDSWRFTQAGATPVVVSSAAEYMVLRRVERERNLDELVAEIAPECQLIVVEGYRKVAPHIIEFQRRAHRDDRIIAVDDPRLVAMVTDNPVAVQEMDAAGKPSFPLEDVEGVARFILGWAGL